MCDFGIVVPAFNEEKTLPLCIQSLQPFLGAGDAVVIVDAASTDETARIVHLFGLLVLRAPSSSRGMAVWMGVKHLLDRKRTWGAIVIAHADMIFSPDSRQSFVQALIDNPAFVGGSFGHRIDEKGIGYRLLEFGNNLRARFLQLPYGDQAQFFCPAVLNEKFQFPVRDSLEDLELALRLRSAGSLIYVNCPVTISSRHWRKGFIFTTLRNWMTLIKYLLKCGISVF